MIIDRYTSRIVDPTAEPISLAQAKRQLRVDGTDEDTFISSLISAARAHVEYTCNTQLVIATYQQKLDSFPDCDTISLGIAPLVDVVSITYVDTDGATQTLSTSAYSVAASEKPGKIKLAYGEFWPITRCQRDAVTIKFRAGYARPFTAAVTDVITLLSSEPTALSGVFLSTTDTLPGGLSLGTAYDTDTAGTSCNLQVSGSGSDVNITSTGTGTHFIGVIPETGIQAMLLLISYWYTTRNASTDVEGATPHVGYLLNTLNWGGI